MDGVEVWLHGYVLGMWVLTLVAQVSGFVVKNAGPTRKRRVAWHVWGVIIIINLKIILYTGGVMHSENLLLHKTNKTLNYIVVMK